MTNLTFLFEKEFLKKAKNNNGFILIGCHGKGEPLLNYENEEIMIVHLKRRNQNRNIHQTKHNLTD